MACALLPLMGLSLSSCVNDDYDLSKDIDATVNFGGDLTLPVSSLKAITMDDILDLKSESSIRAITEEGEYGLHVGDYALTQTGDSEESDFRIKEVVISDHPSDTKSVVLPRFENTGSSASYTQQADVVNNIDLRENDVDTQIDRLDAATLDARIRFTLDYSTTSGYQGTAYVETGFMVEFPAGWTLAVTDAATAQYVGMKDYHTLVFHNPAPLAPGKPMVLTIDLTAMDFAGLSAPQGLHDGHFLLNSVVKSAGLIRLDADEHLPAGSYADLSLVTSTEILDPVITGITGVVSPNIDVDDTSFEITDIPDFLREEGTKLQLENPRILLSIRNTSSMRLTLAGMLEARKANVLEATCGVGATYGTAAIEIEPSATTLVLLSKIPTAMQGYKNIVVPGLGELISIIPDEIIFTDIVCEAVKEVVTIDLGKTYYFNADYEAVVPLALEAGSRIKYTQEDDGWGDDIDKYDFNEAVVTMTADNTLPLELTPVIEALNAAGDVMKDVTATVADNIPMGKSEVTIKLESTATNLAEMKGIRLVFNAVTPAAASGAVMNKSQAVTFDNISIKIIGGITADFN